MGLRHRKPKHVEKATQQVNADAKSWCTTSSRRRALAWSLTMLLTILAACSRFPIPALHRGESQIEEGVPALPPTVVGIANEQGLGIVRGRIVPISGNADTTVSSPVVIYAERIGKTRPHTRGRAATIRRQGDAFAPDLAVVSVEQPVRFRDDGDLFHRIFSYSEPNDFDLGVAGDGKYNSVVFHHPGLVRFYCSLHGWESGAIFVTPSPYFDRARQGGEYELVGLPPGNYRVAAWGEGWRGPSIDVLVEPGKSTTLELPVMPNLEVP